MQGAWLASYIALWATVIVLSCVVLSLMRLMGQMNDRLGPAPALVTEQGPEIGDSFADVLARSKVVEDGILSFPKSCDSLVFFVAPGCPTCETLLQNLRPFRTRRHPTVEVVVVSTSGNHEHNQDLVERTLLDKVPFLSLPKLAESVGIRSTPYAFWLDEDGLVRAKGVVNTMEHLESLRNARAVGFASINEYHQKVHLQQTGEQHGNA